ncbi:MAG: DUF2628 domain-containing protein [Clostridia bacterium]|nr:DUF2628 domain-containing protein [Clostridia bacterium]
MNYENKPCPVCGAHLHQEDDVVVCPVCATPQHRACWMENGRCVNEEKHASGYVWSPDETAVNTGEIPPLREEQAEENGGDSIVCPYCGSENPSFVHNCAHCGADLNAPAQTVYCNFCGYENPEKSVRCERCGAPLLPGTANNYVPYANPVIIDSNERIGELSAGELALYVRKNPVKYLTVFKSIEEHTGAGFNWAAFFLGPLWFFYRKIYAAGIGVILALAGVSLIFNGAMEKSRVVIEPYANEILGGTLSRETLMILWGKMWQVMALPMTVGFGILIAVQIVSGFLANRTYYKKVLSDFRVFNEEIPDPNMRRSFIVRRGGTSFFAALCGFFTYQMADSILLYIADFVANKI